MGKRKPRHKNLVRTTLTKEVADKLVDKVLRGEPLFTDEQYQKNEAAILPLKSGDFELKPATYRAWMRLRTKIPENGRVFYQVMQEARHQYRMKKHEQAQEELVLQAQKNLQELMKLPLGTKTIRKLRKFRIIDGDRKVQTHEEHEEIATPVDSRMVVAKQKGAEYALDRLDPKYKKEANNNVSIMVSLADLRKAKEERDGIRQAKQTGDNSYET